MHTCVTMVTTCSGVQSMISWWVKLSFITHSPPVYFCLLRFLGIPLSLSQGMYFLNGQLLWKVRLQFSCGFSSVLRHGEKISDLLTFYPSPHKMVKHTQMTRQQKPGNCLSVFDHFALKGLKAKYRALETKNKNVVITTSRL